MNPRFLLFCGLAVAIGCASNVTTPPVQPLATQHLVHQPVSETLVAYDNIAGDVEEWTVTSTAGTKASVVASPSFTSNVVAMAGAGSLGSGEEVVLAGASPMSQTSLYDLSTNALERNNPPVGWGTPVDVASIVGGGSLTLYADGSYETMPFDRTAGIHKTECTSILNTADAITADRKGNVFIQGTGPDGFAGVVELAQSTQTCSALSLKPQQGTAAGITVNPANGELIVGDNPNSCSGSSDGRLIVYTAPYSANSGTIRSLSGVGCAGLFRVDSGSTGTTYIFMLDSDGGSPQIDELKCCIMMFKGSYSGGDPSAPTTLPNSLPNG